MLPWNPQIQLLLDECTVIMDIADLKKELRFGRIGYRTREQKKEVRRFRRARLTQKLVLH